MSNKGRIPPHAWTTKQQAILIEMWNANASTTEIGAVVGKSRNSIANYVRINQKTLGIKPRPKSFYTGDLNNQRKKHFDAEWSGAVTFGHWSITKPWGWSQGFTEALREAIRAGVEVRYGIEA